MNSTWLIAPSSRLRLAMRNAARAASARASAVASESALVLSRSSDCCTSSCICCVELVALGRGLARDGVRLAHGGAARAAVEERPVEQQRDRARSCCRGRIRIPRPGCRHRRRATASASGRPCASCTCASLARVRCVELRELGPVGERRRAQVRQRACRARCTSAADVGVLERRVERPIEQEVEIALRLRCAVPRLARLLRHGQQLGARAQHLVLRDLAVAKQRIVDAQVFVEQRHARVDDALRAHRRQPVRGSRR